jgi:DNA-directed RNA polymerase subunit RPC12/RpoP
MSYFCVNCNKKYTKKSSMDKHKILCDYKLLTQREKKVMNEEAEDMPSYIDLVKLVQELAKKCNKLEEKVENMQKWVDRKKKKINVIKWLNTNMNVFVSYVEWVNEYVEILPIHFEYLMEHNLYETIEHILKYNLNKNDLLDSKYPIICFTEKNAIFYIAEIEKDNDNGNNIYVWKKALHEDNVLLIKKIYNKLLYELTKWKKDNEHSFLENSKLSDKFNKAVIKLMSISFHEDATFSRIRNILYNNLKIELKEFDLEF